MKSLLSRSMTSLLLLLALGCSARRRPDATGVPPASNASGVLSAAHAFGLPPTSSAAIAGVGAPTPFVMPYPRAAWRLAKPDDLEHVVLWVSHILIRHKDSRDEVSFNIGFWTSVAPPSTRTRDEALVLARDLAARASREPQSFPDLARKYSEDVPSREEGGAMGGYRASVLMLWPQILDGFSALRPGQSSQVIETKYGFHVLQRGAPPPERAVSGAHIVIGHRDAPWLEVFARSDPRTESKNPSSTGKATSSPHSPPNGNPTSSGKPTRSREEAWALAQDVYRQASAHPERFGELVQKYSEHADSVLNGDFGSWSTRSPFAFPARMKRLSELEEGTVGAPIETHLGFEIVLRSHSRPREQYRAQLRVFPFDEASSSAPQTDANALERAYADARGALQLSQRDGQHFARAGAGEIVMQWEEGRELPELTAQLKGTPVGALIPRPVRTEYGVVIAKRLAAEAVHEPQAQTELPSPTEPDLDSFLDLLSPQDTVAFFAQFANYMKSELPLAGATADQFRAIHSLSAKLMPQTQPEERVKIAKGVLSETRALLGEKTYAQYRSNLNVHMTAVLLTAPANSPRERGF